MASRMPPGARPAAARVRPAEARDAAGRRGRSCRCPGTERTRRIADRLAREGHRRAEAAARAAQPGTRRPAEEAGGRARRGSRRPRRACAATGPGRACPSRSARRPSRPKTTSAKPCRAAGRSQAEAVPRTKPAPKADTGPSFLDTLTDNWMILLGAAALVILGLLGFNFFRRRRDEDVDGALKGFDLPAVRADADRDHAPAGARDRRQDGRAARPPMFEDRTTTMTRTSSSRSGRSRARRPRRRVRRRPRGNDQCRGGARPRQADPLAEADFHMAYGLYDQAVDLVRMALRRSRSAMTSS